MKSNKPRKKQMSDFSSQDESSMRRGATKIMHDKRSKKPSIYDEMDDEFSGDYEGNLVEDEFDGYDDNDYIDEDEDERY
jgi:hypothetical protein